MSHVLGRVSVLFGVIGILCLVLVSSQEQLCPALQWDVETTVLQCQPPMLQDAIGQGRNVSCDKAMPPGTRAFPSCRQFYKLNRQISGDIICKQSGQWSQALPQCQPQCGNSSSVEEPKEDEVSTGKVSAPGQFPWHAAIFHQVNADDSSSWQLRCGGTLISRYYVITAARCVTAHQDKAGEPTLMDVKNIHIVLGKYYKDWDSESPTETRIGVKEVRMRDSTKNSQKYIQEIALLRLNGTARLSKFVMPVCINFMQKRLIFNNSSFSGYVAGWDKEELCSEDDEGCQYTGNVLKYWRMNVRGDESCHAATYSDHRSLNVPRNLASVCAGNYTESATMPIESGAGLTFVFDGLHHVFGVVGSSIDLPGNIGVFTTFAYFPSFFNKNG